MKKSLPFLFLTLFVFIFSCEETDEPLNQNTEEQVEQEYNLSGRVQKGPFLNGTSITVSELDKDLKQTGKVYTTQITNNEGYFEIPGVRFSSSYVELMANGFYFNEVSNENSQAQLTLHALADLTNKSTLNVNILSTLEKQRVKHLIEQGLDFESAKAQAMNELFHVFSFDTLQLINAEDLDISSVGEENGKLLAISTIIQEYKSPASLSEFVANLSNDMVEDGKLDDKKLQSSLINAATKLKIEKIISNLEERYSSIGVTATFPDMQTHIDYFIENSTYEKTDVIEYPASGEYGPNFLSPDVTYYPAGDYSMKAILPEGYTLKVKIMGENWGHYAFQQNTGWSVGEYNEMDGSTTFTAMHAGEIDHKMVIPNTDEVRYATVYIYENESSEPTRTKKLISSSGSGFSTPSTGNFGQNILALTDSTVLTTDQNYSITAKLPDDRDYNVEIKLHFSQENTYSIDSTQVTNWEYYVSPFQLRLVIKGKNKQADLPIQFHNSGSLTIEGGVEIHGINW